MLSQRIIEKVCNKVKDIVMEAESLIEGELIPQSASQVSEVLNDLASTIWGTAMKTQHGWFILIAVTKIHFSKSLRAVRKLLPVVIWIEDHEIEEEKTVLEVDEKKYRFKCLSDKTFLTPGGEMTIARRIFQSDKGGKCHVPLDAAWGMEGERSTVEVRDAVLYSAALLTAKESATLFAKCSLFQPKETNIKKLAAQMGAWLEKHEAEVLVNIQSQETVPPETEIVCASLDGVNVLLSESGKKRDDRKNALEINRKKRARLVTKTQWSALFRSISKGFRSILPRANICMRCLAPSVCRAVMLLGCQKIVSRH